MGDTAYYLRNRERILERKKARYRADPTRYIRETADWAVRHPAQAAANKRRSYLANRDEAMLLRFRERSFRQRYGITLEERDALIAAQGGRCAICTRQFGEDLGPHIDHDHATALIRGVLCGSCNRGIGLLREDPDLLRAALRYLEEAR